VLIYVQRMPSNNDEIGTWYASSIANRDWPQYAALERKLTTDQVWLGALGYSQVHACT